MSKKIVAAILGVFSTLAFSQAYADLPNLYTCKGTNVAFSYRTYAIGPETIDTVFLTLDLWNKHFTAGKANIESKKTVIGTILTTTVQFMPDVFIKKASVILPAINLGQNFQGDFITKASFKSQLVLTTIATPFIPTPYIGVINKSNYIELNCTASLVLIPL